MENQVYSKQLQYQYELNQLGSANAHLIQLPVLMVTANTEKEQESIMMGASDFISKPYDIEILCARTLNYAKLNKYHQAFQNQSLNQSNFLQYFSFFSCRNSN